MLNGPTHALAKTIKSAMASAMEAEMKALFINAQLLAELRLPSPGGMVAVASNNLRKIYCQKIKNT